MRINWSSLLEMGVALVDSAVLTIDTVEKCNIPPVCAIPAAVLSVYRFMKAIEDLWWHGPSRRWLATFARREVARRPSLPARLSGLARG
ncbi:MAG: hypothetical protein RXP86_12030 [Acidilobus sp.]